MKREFIYYISKLNQPLVLDGNWNKPEWQKIQAIQFQNHMGQLPGFVPQVHLKMMYNDESLFVIFKVDDQFVRCITDKINGPVYEDACVEFFFAPDKNYPNRYFNLEVNCGGTALFHYNTIARKEKVHLTDEEINHVEIAHSLPKIVDPEIKEPVTWTIEYRIPIDILKKYSQIDIPEKGTRWKANFYKIAESGSNIHFITWTQVNLPKPDFHQPEFFGEIVFD